MPLIVVGVGVLLSFNTAVQMFILKKVVQQGEAIVRVETTLDMHIKEPHCDEEKIEEEDNDEK